MWLVADSVYRARDPLLDREIALKVPHASTLQSETRRARVLTEAKAAAALLVVLVAVVASIGYVTTSHARNRAVSALAGETAARRQVEKEKSLAESALVGETAARREAEKQLLRAEWLLYASNIHSAQREWETNNVRVAWSYLDSCRADFRGWEYSYLYTLFNQNQVTLKGHTEVVHGVAFSADGKRIASGSWDGTLKVWDASLSADSANEKSRK